MVGFIKRLFRSNSNNNPDQSNSENSQSGKDFFLDPDEAKTYGDIDFMRQPIQMKKSFPKTLSNPQGSELIEEVSALEKKEISQKGLSQNVSNTNFQVSNQQTSSPASNVSNTPSANFSNTQDPTIKQRRQSDSSIDMFRDMAREINKK